jgi:hypothetical protein
VSFAHFLFASFSFLSFPFFYFSPSSKIVKLVLWSGPAE